VGAQINRNSDFGMGGAGEELRVYMIAILLVANHGREIIVSADYVNVKKSNNNTCGSGFFHHLMNQVSDPTLII
jgi:hypothetical protein